MRSYANGDEAVHDVTRRILAEGSEVDPRGLQTREILHECFAVRRPYDAIPVGIGRPKLSLAMAALESMQNVGGAQRPDLFRSIAPASSKFSMLVYGERLAAQMPLVESLLRRDPETRQAVATVWREELLEDEEAGSNHCALSLQFLLRGGVLDLAVYMRSNDAWWGLTYDLVQFAQVQCTLAGVLGAACGKLVWHATSMHLYERHWDVAAELWEPATRDTFSIERRLHGVSGKSWNDAACRARTILDGVLPVWPTDTERWMWEQLIPHVQNAAPAAIVLCASTNDTDKRKD